MVSNLDQQEYHYLLGIWFVFSVLSPSIAYYFPLFNLIIYKKSFSMGYLGFLFLGCYIDRYINQKISILWVGALVISILVPWVLTWHHNLHATKLPDIYLGGFHIFVVLQATCFFMLAKYLFNWPNRAIAFLANLSFTAYCCHIIVRLFFNNSPLVKPVLPILNSISPTAEVLFKFAFVTFFSYLIAYLLSLLPKKISYYFGV